MYVLFNRHEVGKYLCGVIHIGEAIPYGYACVLCQKLYNFLLEAAILNAVIEAAEHLCGVLERLLFTHLAV